MHKLFKTVKNIYSNLARLYIFPIEKYLYFQLKKSMIGDFPRFKILKNFLKVVEL